MRSNNPKYHLVTKCCSSTVYRDKGSYQLLCSKCSGRAEYQKIPNLKYVLSGEKSVKGKGQFKPKVIEYPPYKPVKTLSARDRNEEILARTSKIAEYVNNPGVGDERKFIEERIKWNSERIATLLA